MAHLMINNVGPIKKVDVELKRFNFFIGPQSSGKSTIAKVLSTCSWIEKEVCTSLKVEVFKSAADFRLMMADYHKMQSYFGADSEVFYDSEFVTIHLKGDDLHIAMKPGYNYHRQKICYIPSERNMVALQELQGFEFGQTNLRSFLFDWFTARQQYNADNRTGVLGLGVDYYYDKDSPRTSDHISHANGQSYDIPLSSASSGLQSLIPLMVMLQYYTGGYYTQEAKTSSLQREKTKLLSTRLEDELVLKALYGEDFSPDRRLELIKRVNEGMQSFNLEIMGVVSHYIDICNQLTKPDKTSFIIEEPEQNLFPTTQRDLVNLMLDLCSKDRHHSLTITTHSPYILYSLNNCLLAYITSGSMPEGQRCAAPAINPKDVGVWQIDKGGFVSDVDRDNQTIQDDRGLIRKNFFDNVMRDIMNDFTNMLGYLD